MNAARWPLLCLISVWMASAALAAPVISTIPDQSVAEDTSTSAIAFSITGLQTRAPTVTGSADNSQLVGSVVIGGTGGSRTVTVTPLPNQNGQATITISVVDGTAGSATKSFALTVTAVNDPPTITDLSDQTINEDQSLGPVSFTVDDIDTPVSRLTVTTSTSNPTLVPAGNISVGGAGNARTLTVTPAANQSGSVTIGVFVSDGNLNASTRCTLTVNAVNDPPTISDIPDQSISENGVAGPVSFSVSDPETAATSLTVTGSSSNPGLVPDGNIALASVIGAAPVRTVTMTPLPNQSGTATITVTVSDGNLTATDQFVLTVNAVNDPPTISSIPTVTTAEDTTSAPAAFTVADPDTPLANLTLSADSSVPSLIPQGGISFGGSGANRTVTVTPAPNQSGAATITVSVSDGAASATTQFRVSVSAVNDPPTISDITDRTISESSNTGPIAFTVGDIDTDPANLTVSGSSSNPNLVPNGAISFAGSAASRTVTVTPTSGQSGTATITVTVSDGSATASDTFLLTVTSVNHPPTISEIPLQTINEDSTPGAIPFTIGDSDTGAANLTLQVKSDNQNLIPDTAISLGGSGANRTVTITPRANQFGVAQISLTVSDGSLTTEGRFIVRVSAVNDPPTISNIPDQTVQGGSNTGAIAFTIDDPDNDAANLTLTPTSSNLALVPINAIAFGGSGNNRTVTVTPVGNQSGSAIISVIVSDGAASASDTFTVTVSAVVEAPKVVTPPQNLTVNLGDTATFTVTATGTAPLAYQWLFNGKEIAGATSSTFFVRNAQLDQAGSYSVRVSNSVNSATSAAATLVVQAFDFGDAPESALAVLYHTTLASKGPRHKIVAGFFLGRSVDAEPDGQPSADALGDDNAPSTADDEDGVQFASALAPGKTATLVVTASAQGILDAWFDFNRAGGFETAEHVINHVALVPGANTVTVPVPANAVTGDTFARFRLSRTGLDTPDDLGSTIPDGEVEDYKVTITAEAVQLDFGDAPDLAPGAVGGLGYPTLLANNGARHVIVPGFFLGKSIDAETDGQPNATATGDDIKPEQLDDEDGVQFLTAVVPGQSAQVAVTASQAGRLDAWLDFNRNRSWADPGEQIFTSTALTAGLNTLNFPVPPAAQGGVTYARFRFSKNGKLGPTGQAPDGEVEDYQVSIEASAPCDVNYKGTEFWLTFPGNYPPSDTAPLTLTLCLVGSQGVTGTVAIPGLRFSKDFVLPASMLVGITLPDEASLGDVVDVVQTRGIHVTASAPVAVYGLNRIPYSSDGYLGLPVGALGKDYLVSGYPNVFSEVSALNGSQFALVAAEDDTTVTIVPSRAVLGHPAGDPFQVLLKKGQTYQLRDPNDAAADLTGTELTSDKPIALFGGHQCANVNSPSKLFCDHLVEQLLPTTAWGKIFHTVPLATRSGGDSFRILAAYDATKIFVNAVETATIDRGQVHTLTLTSATRLNTDKPVLVTQLANSSDYDGVVNADPSMLTVPPTRFYTKEHMICTGPADFSKHFVNVVAPASVVGALTLDGAAVPAASFTPIGASGFSFARLSVAPGAHALAATQPFATTVYGYSLYESYAWPGGMYFGDITPPTIVCPPDFTVNVGGVSSTTGALSCKAPVPDLRQKAQVSDNCPLPSERVVTQTPPPGTLLGVGEYPITLTARDAADNEATCVVTMTVVDPGPAVLTCPKDTKVLCNKGSGAAVAYQVVAQTACGTAIDVQCSPPSGALFPLGTTTVQCQVPGSPNQACSFKVTVECPPAGSNVVALPKPLTFSWPANAVLETSFSLEGPWTAVPGAVPPFAPSQGEERQFFRVIPRQPASTPPQLLILQ